MADTDSPITLDPVRLAVWCVIITTLLAGLIIGKSLLIPLAIAILLWVLLDAIRGALIRWSSGATPMPRGVATLLAILFMLAGNYLVVWIVLAQAEAFAAALPVYQANFETLLLRGAALLGLDELPTTASMLEQIDVQPMLGAIGDSIGSLVSSIVLILIYLGFLLAEEKIIPGKLKRLPSDPDKKEQLQ
ncbi:MAG: AI-2E family transporter [Gammaproteobacteria bacterium]|nr:AI-2E family transporter [Gammaproteobacteria bacterium]